jgi:pre-60S factor REI1
MQSKKHKDLEAKLPKDVDQQVEPIKKQPVEPKTKDVQLDEEPIEEDEKNWEDIEENEDIEIDESTGVDLKTCLFCEHQSQNIEAKCEHMAKEHSFFIPDADCVSDLEGLLKFLGVKLGCYHVCLWCSSKCYPSLKAVQMHMFDKGHNKMKFEGDTLYEYADFYTYDKNENYSESDSDSNVSEEDEVERFVEDENYELCLPSGKFFFLFLDFI